MQTYLKSKPVGIQLLLFIGLAFGTFSIFGFIGATVLPRITGIELAAFQNVEKWDASNPNLIIFVRGMLLLQFLGLFLIPVMLYSYFADPEPGRFLGLRAPHHFSYFILGIAALMVAIPFVEYIGLLNRRMTIGSGTDNWMKEMEETANRQIQFMLGKQDVPDLLLNLVFIAVFAGVGEELFFRGVLQRLFIRLTKNPWIGIILTAILFSGFHLQFYGFFPRLLLGVLLGVIYWYSGSLWVAIVAHFAYDAFIILVVFANPQMISNPEASLVQPLAISAIISLALTAFLVWRMVKMSRTSYEEVYKDDEPTDQISF